jgi:hypothetical protein
MWPVRKSSCFASIIAEHADFEGAINQFLDVAQVCHKNRSACC